MMIIRILGSGGIGDRPDIFRTICAQAPFPQNSRTDPPPPPHLLYFLTLSHRPPAFPITHFQKNSSPPVFCDVYANKPLTAICG
jgi:hypothetical protein